MNRRIAPISLALALLAASIILMFAFGRSGGVTLGIETLGTPDFSRDHETEAEASPPTVGETKPARVSISITSEVNASDPNPRLGVAISVVDETLGLVPDADVFVYSESATRVLGRTGRRGEPVLASDELAGTVFARVEGMVATPRRLSSAAEGELSIHVQASGRIEGEVLTGAGEPAQEGTSVLIWKGAEGNLPNSLYFEALAGNPDYLLVSTGADGRFQAAGLSPGQLYSLAAGGAGHVCSQPVHGVQVGEYDLVLRMAYSYAGLIQLLTPQGEPIVIPVGAGPQCRIRTEPLFSSADLTPIGSWALPLAGTQFDTLGEEGAIQIPIAYTAETPIEQAGPFKFFASIPGHPDLDTTFSLPRYYGGEVASIDFAMGPVPEYNGAIVARFVAADQLLEHASVTRKEPIGRVYLASAHGKLVFSFSSFGEGVEMGNLQPGKYQVRYGVTVAGGLLPDVVGETLTLMVADGAVELELDCHEFANAEFSLGGSVEPYDGPATVMIRKEGDVNRFVHFTHAPYEVPGLLAGTYSARVHLPVDMRTMSYAEFELGKGERRSIRLD